MELLRGHAPSDKKSSLPMLLNTGIRLELDQFQSLSVSPWKTNTKTPTVLEMLIEHDYPFVICTKSPLVAASRYDNLLKSTEKIGVQVSLISLDDNLLGCLESSTKSRTPSAKSR